MLENDIIRPSESPWNSPIILVKKRIIQHVSFAIAILDKQTQEVVLVRDRLGDRLVLSDGGSLLCFLLVG